MGSEAGKWPRIILHADMDAFYAAIEQHDHPELLGKPVIVGGTGRRGVVAAASYEARPFGIHSAMPSAQAHRLCPNLIALPCRFDRYYEVSSQIMEVFDTLSPLVEPLSLDEAFLDMTGAEGLFGPPERMGRRLKEKVFEATDGLTVSVGAATTKYVAKVASDFDTPDGLTVVPPDGVHDFLWPLRVGRLWGVGKKTQQLLDDMGLKTIGDVARADPKRVKKRLGALGDHILRLAWGQDPRDVVSDHKAKSVGAESTLEEDVVGEHEITPHLRRAVERVTRRLRKHNLLAGAIRVKLKTSGFQLLTRQAPLAAPTDSNRELFDAACELLGQFDLSVPFRLVGAAGFDLCEGEALTQTDLFEEPRRQKQRKLDRTLDSVRDRFGDEALKRASELARAQRPLPSDLGSPRKAGSDLESDSDSEPEKDPE